MVLGFRGIAIPGPIIIFFITNINWLWLPVMWYLGASLLDIPGRYLLKKAGMTNTTVEFGMYQDILSIKDYFKKNE